MEPIPLFLRPYFSQTVWGGKRLRTKYHKPIPSDHTGESFEVSTHPAGHSIITSGPLANLTLAEAVQRLGRTLTGTQGDDIPILIKLIDARESLSVQVHPDDAYAEIHEGGSRGKTEAWVILDAPADATIVYGIKATRAEFEQAIIRGDLGGVLSHARVRAGDVILIPAGTVHAIGKDILLYEVQESSDITYRVYDWDRQPPRELHIRQALDVVSDQPPPQILRPDAGAKRAPLLETPYFTLERWNAEAGLQIETDGRSFLAVTALDPGKIRFEGGSADFEAGQTFLLMAKPARYHIQAGQLLVSAAGRRP